MKHSERRWSVVVEKVTGDRELLKSSLATLGFELDKDRLSCSDFENLNNPGDVRAIVNTLRRTIDEISALDPELDMSFTIASVNEKSTDGINRIHDVAEIGESVVMKLVGYPPTVLNTSLTDEEQLEQIRRAKADRAGSLLSAALADDNVLKVMRLVKNEASYTRIYKAYEIIRKSVGKRMLRQVASEDDWKRFTGTLNHPDASGHDARHAHLNDPGPKKPMTKQEVYAFAKTMVEWWITRNS